MTVFIALMFMLVFDNVLKWFLLAIEGCTLSISRYNMPIPCSFVYAGYVVSRLKQLELQTHVFR